jgi:hypothetical protein
MMKTSEVTMRARGITLVLALAALLAAGCLGEPEIDERWNLLEFLDGQPRPGETMAAGEDVPVTVKARVTFRAILTGTLVAEVRYSETLPPAATRLDRDEHTLEQALMVERILAESVTAGRATRLVTGFDHLMRTVDLEFSTRVPPAMLSGGPDSLATRGLYLVLYMGEGEEIELPGGADSLVVTPFAVEDSEVLFCGFPLDVDTSGGPRP